MDWFYFPLLFLRPDSNWDACERERFRLIRRKWDVSIFDLATLATRHRLHVPYQLIDVLLQHCNLELAIRDVDRDTAVNDLSALTLGLFLVGVSPTVAPFEVTHSLNDYSGVNSRDSDMLERTCRSNDRRVS